MPVRLVVLLAVAALWPALSEPETAGAADGTSAPPEAPPQETVGGAAAGDVPSSAASETVGEAASAAMTNATEQAKLDLEEVMNATAAASASLRGSSGWGHGIFGETCCMCSVRAGWTTVLYAAADYSNFFGGHAANWWCQQECEVKCHFKGGHMFGCYDEQHLLAMDRLYGHRSGYTILHDQHFGNIC